MLALIGLREMAADGVADGGRKAEYLDTMQVGRGRVTRAVFKRFAGGWEGQQLAEQAIWVAGCRAGNLKAMQVWKQG